jgi:hypothetical protein
VRKKGGESGEAGVGVDDFYSGRNTAFTAFTTFFGAGSGKWRRRFFTLIFLKSPV